jgi:hypothetical protein
MEEKATEPASYRKVPPMLFVLTGIWMVVFYISIRIQEHYVPVQCSAQENTSMYWMIYFFGVFIVPAALFLYYQWVGKRRGRKIIFYVYSYYTIIILLFAAWGVFDLINAWMDEGPERVIPTNISMSFRSSGRSQIPYIKTKVKRTDVTYTFEVSEKAYPTFKMGEEIILHIKPGFFRRPWLVRYERPDQEKSK